MIRLALWGLFLLLTTCSAALPGSYCTVGLDFEERLAFARGSAEWARITHVPLSAKASGADVQIAFAALPGATLALAKRSEMTVMFDLDKIHGEADAHAVPYDMLLQDIWMHELGHLYGLEHQGHGIMAARMTYDRPLGELDFATIEAFERP